MAKPSWADAPHWGSDDVTLGDTYECPRGTYAYKCQVPRARVIRSKSLFDRQFAMPISGSTAAIKKLQSPLSSGREQVRPDAPAEKPTRQANGLSKIAWSPQRDLDHSDWLATGRRLGAIGRCSQWWVGDWVRYGTARWGEKYAEAARVTGYDVASLRNMAWVASRFDLSLRNDKLTWSHHVLLAPLERDEQRHWLQRASEQRLSVADLRLELRGLRGGESKPSAERRAEGERAGLEVCPHCGHTLR